MHMLKIDVVSDVICPWCYLGKRRLELALDQVRPEIEATLAWHPFQLDPTIPEEGVDSLERLTKKFGSLETVKGSQKQLTDLGAEIGLNYAFDKVRITPNTFDAHRLIHWAGEQDLAVQNGLVDLLFKAYFEDGLNLCKHDVLTALASQAGMDGPVVEHLLAGDADKSELQDEIASIGKMGVTGVPFFIINNSYAVTGAQPVDVLVNAFREIAALQSQNLN